MGINNEKTAKSMLDLIKELIKQQLDNKDQVALCQIASPGSDGRYNIYVVPDDANVIHGIPNKFGFDLNTGDYVYVYKVGNQFAQSFIFAKVGENLDLRGQLNRLMLENEAASSTGPSQETIIRWPAGPVGPQGPTGNTWFSGNDVGADQGDVSVGHSPEGVKVGDFYFNEEHGDVYRYNESKEWTKIAFNVDFSRVQSKIKCGDVPTFENEANQAVGDFFIVESDETPREEPIKKVANSKAKATSIPVSESPTIVSIQQADEETKPSNPPTLGASSSEKTEKKYKQNSLTLTISGNNDEEDNKDTGSHESKAPTLTLGESSADTDTKPNTGCLVLG